MPIFGILRDLVGIYWIFSAVFRSDKSTKTPEISEKQDAYTMLALALIDKIILAQSTKHKKMLTRVDTKVLNRAFIEIYNQTTGVGTERDKSTHAEINTAVIQLPEEHLRNLPRLSGIIKRATFLHPLDAFRGQWYRLKVGGEGGVNPEDIQKYIKDITGAFRFSMLRATALGRQHGDGFILKGIADGRPPDQPVDEEAIASVRWLKPVTKYEIKPDFHTNYLLTPHDPEHYRLYLYNNTLPDDPDVKGTERNGTITGRKIISDILWHKSRVMRFSGDYLYDEALRENGGYHDSVIQSMFNAWVQWSQGVQASSSMLQDYNQFTLGIKGLGRLTGNENGEKTEEELEEAREYIVQRALTLALGMSVSKTLFHDLGGEEPGVVSRNYSGADKIMERLEAILCAVSTTPRFKLFNEIGATGLATGVQAAIILKSEWGIQNNGWLEDTVRKEVETFVRQCTLAQDSPTRGQPVEGLEVDFPLQIILSPLEQAELQKLIAERDEKNIKSGIYTGLEARILYERAEFDPNLVLEPMDEARGQAKDVLLKKLLQQGESKPDRFDNEDEDTDRNPNNGNGRVRQRQDSFRTDDATRAKKILKWNGFKIGLQYLPFEERHGRSLQSGYGWIANTIGADNMALDCYFCPMPTNKVFVVEQVINGEFDEEKLIVGARSLEHARDIYLSAMPREFLGKIRKESIEYIKSFMKPSGKFSKG